MPVDSWLLKIPQQRHQRMALGTASPLQEHMHAHPLWWKHLSNMGDVTVIRVKFSKVIEAPASAFGLLPQSCEFCDMCLPQHGLHAERKLMFDDHSSRAIGSRVADLVDPVGLAGVASSRDQPDPAPVFEVSFSCL